MARVRHSPKIVQDRATGRVILEVRGLAGTVVYRGTDTAATLEDYAGVPLSQPITITEDSFVPGFDAVGDIPAIYHLDWKSGEWVIPLDSPEGLEAFASESAAAAVAAADRAEAATQLADVVDLVAGTNITLTQTEAGLEISATGGTGGGEATSSTVDGITDATTLSKTLLKTSTASSWRSTLGITALLTTITDSITSGLAGKQAKGRHVDAFYDPVTGWPNPTRTGNEYRLFDSVEYVDAPAPPMVTRDRWNAHPESQVYIDRISGPVVL